MKQITILSGKGGTGKSTVVSSLAVLLSKHKKLIAVDCDVDAPNFGLCLGVRDKDFDWVPVETGYKAKLMEDKCTHCGKCREICRFGAISWNDHKKQPIFNRLLCEGCGSCKLICPSNAIKLVKVKNGRIGYAKTKYGFNIVSGQLKMGESGSGKIVAFIKNKAGEIVEKEAVEIMLVDSAAGIGCPVIASVNGSDYIVAVTEPTPSALSDLKKGLKVVEHFRIPYGLIINRFDINKNFTKKIEDFARKNNVPILGKIPYNKEFVNALVNLTPAPVWNKTFQEIFEKIVQNILKEIK